MSKLLTRRPSKPKAPTPPNKYLASYSVKDIYSSDLSGIELEAIMKEHGATFEDISITIEGSHDRYYSENHIEILIQVPVLNKNYGTQMAAYRGRLKVYQKKMELYEEKLEIWKGQKKLRDDRKRDREIEALEHRLSKLKG